MKTSEIRRLRVAIRKLDRLTALQIKRCTGQVTVAQCHLLLEVEGMKEATTLRLAEAMQLDKSTVSLTVDGLVKEGMLERRPDPEDRRVTRLLLTRKGRAVCDAINEINDDYLKGVFATIPRERRKAVIDHFALFVEAIARHERTID